MNKTNTAYSTKSKIPCFWFVSGTSLLLAIVFVISYKEIKLDDAYIYFTFVENLANGHGYVFNIGEKVYGTTSALYTLLLSLTYYMLKWTGLTVPDCAMLIGGISLVTLSIFMISLLRSDGLRVTAFSFPILLIFNPALGYAFGMETYLTLALITASLYYYKDSKIILTFTLLGLSILSRPDSLLFVVLVIVDFIQEKRAIPPISALVAFALVLIPWITFSLWYFGSPIPLTLSAKMSQGNSGSWGNWFPFFRGLTKAFYQPSRFEGEFHWAIIPSFILPVGYMIYFRKLWIRKKSIVLILLWNLVYILTYSIFINPPAYGWYYVPITVGISLIQSAFIETQLSSIKVGRIFLLFFVALGIIVLYNTSSMTSAFSLNNDRYSTFRSVASWLNDNATPGSSVASNEIGVLGFFYENGPVIDTLGLITPGVSKHIENGNYYWAVKNHQPDYVVLHNPGFAIIESYSTTPEFKENYYRVQTFQDGEYSLILFRRRSTNISVPPIGVYCLNPSNCL